MAPVFVSFYTPLYKDEAAALTATLKQFNLEHDIAAVPAGPSWAASCAKKPHVIAAAMLRYHTGHTGGRPIVWVDADARIKRDPRLFTEIGPDVDIAYYTHRTGELLSGTLYFGNTSWAVALVRKWAEHCRKNDHLWDQQVLEKILADNPALFNRAALPAAYCYIWDDGTLDAADVVIEHMQASRRLRY